MAGLICRSVFTFAGIVSAVANTADGASPDTDAGTETGVFESLALESECRNGDIREGSCGASWLQRHGLKLSRNAGGGSERDLTRVGSLDLASSEVSTTEGQLPGDSVSVLEKKINASKGVAGFCDTHTGGSCWAVPCHASRGPTQCVSHECRCLPGYCALYGSCRKNKAGEVSCPRSTGGTCKLLSCARYRGPTDCVGGQCLCKEGYCSGDDGTCHRHNGEFKASVVEVNSESPVFPGDHGKVHSALCFSGGGSRSLSLTLGALRALESLQLMGGVDAISSVSGGSWASSIYMFAKMDLEELLGAPTDPAKLSMHELGRTPPPLGDAARSNVIQAAESLFKSTNYNELWIKTFAEALLKPFGLGDDATYMAASPESVEAIVGANPQLHSDQFLVPQSGRPRTFVMSGTLLAPEGHEGDGRNSVSLQMSPDWTGSPFYPDNGRVSYASTKGGSGRGRNKPLSGIVVGGGLVQTFAFGGEAPAQQSGGQEESMEAPPIPLSLAKAVGISSAAFASLMSQVPLFSDTAAKLVPKVDYWPVMSSTFPGTQPAMRYEVGDGGNLENTGVLAMLQRRAQRIAWFVNTDVGISDSIDFCASAALGPNADMKGLVTNQLTDKFGFRSSERGMQASFLNNNQVFETEEFFPLLCELQKQKSAGKPAVALKSLTVRRNNWWGIVGGFKVDLLVVYNEKCSDFIGSLPADTQAELSRGVHGAFAHFPWFKTVRQNREHFTSYTSEQINLLAAQSEYAVRQNVELFRQIFQ